MLGFVKQKILLNFCRYLVFDMGSKATNSDGYFFPRFQREAGVKSRSCILNLIGFLKYAQLRKTNSKSIIMRAGFTLVELAIVLVIIGLVIGGALVGNDLIKAAEIRKVVGDYQKYESNYNTFKSMYNCVVGDCRNATSIFGSGTINGEGNGRISAYDYEDVHVCNHFMLAGLFNGNCSASFPTGGGMFVGVNALPSSYKSGYKTEIGNLEAFCVGSWQGTWGSAKYCSFNSINTEFESPTGTYGPVSLSNSLGGMDIPDAKSLDEKIDDGKPFTGRIFQPDYLNSCGVTATNVYATSPLSWRLHPCPSFYSLGNG